MLVLRTERESVTGKILYSDTYFHKDIAEITIRPFLNKWAMIPVIGMLAGVVRVALAIIHMIGHLMAALVLCNREHLYHVVKGNAEFLRGLIEMIPIVGNMFVWKFDANDKTQCAVFLVRIFNPKNLESIDSYLNDHSENYESFRGDLFPQVR